MKTKIKPFDFTDPNFDPGVHLNTIASTMASVSALNEKLVKQFFARAEFDTNCDRPFIGIYRASDDKLILTLRGAQ